jgi:HPt (histidine-containing phosphotransfer) domain-containing protein
MNDYLAKPIGRRELEAALAEWLGRQSKTSDGTTPSKHTSTDAPPAEPVPAVPASGDEAALPAADATPPGDASEAETFNVRATLDRLDGNEKLLFRLIQLFQRESLTILSELRQAMNERNATGLRAGAHKLKGALASRGGDAARQVAARLEEMAAAGDLDPAPPSVDTHRQERGRHDGELERYVAERPS